MKKEATMIISEMKLHRILGDYPVCMCACKKGKGLRDQATNTKRKKLSFLCTGSLTNDF